MKRRYKPGDWFRVPLFARADALGIITHASGSRLFGYFFAAGRGEISFDTLRALRAGSACARFLFGALPIESLRWPIVATSLAFDAEAWPLPPFAQRGAFGRRWTLRTFDPSTVRKCSERESDAAEAAMYPAAQFLSADDAEIHLAHAIDGRALPAARVICEVRAPVDVRSLEPLAHGGCVQVSAALSASDADTLARTVGNAPVELRVHDVYGKPFDVSVLAGWPSLPALTLDTENVANVRALGALPNLRRLRLPAHALARSGACENVRELHVTGDGERVDLQAWNALQSLVCDNVSPDLDSLAGLPLRYLSLRCAHADVRGAAALTLLDRLELRDVPLESLEVLRGARTRTLVLSGIRLVRDVEALAQLPNLELVRFERMPQLHPADFDALVHLTGLRVLSDSGNRTLDREIQRRFLRGTSTS